MNNDVVSTVIVWTSPFIGGAFLWLLLDKIKSTDKKIDDVHVTAKVTSSKVQELDKTLVEIQTDIRYINKNLPINEKEFEGRVINIFENSAVKVIKNARKRFE